MSPSIGPEPSVKTEASAKGTRGAGEGGAGIGAEGGNGAAAEGSETASRMPERTIIGGHVAYLLSHAEEPIRETAASAFDWLGAPGRTAAL